MIPASPSPSSSPSPVPVDRGFIIGLSMSQDSASIALRSADGHISERLLEGHASHARDALATVADLMRQAEVRASDCVAVAADMGPGGFTGLRTACGFAQGLAVGWGVPVVLFSSLEIMASAAMAASGRAGLCLAALDARQAEVYVGVYQVPLDLDHGLPEVVLAPSLCAYGQAPSEGGAALLAVGPGVAHLDPHSLPPLDASVLPRAGMLVRLAATAGRLGRGVAPARCLPLYVRDQVALTTAQRRARLDPGAV